MSQLILYSDDYIYYLDSPQKENRIASSDLPNIAENSIIYAYQNIDMQIDVITSESTFTYQKINLISLIEQNVYDFFEDENYTILLSIQDIMDLDYGTVIYARYKG